MLTDSVRIGRIETMKILSDTELISKETRIARLRSQLFKGTNEQDEAISEEIARIKAECADTWHSRHQQVVGDRMTGMGY